jgi:hypothetical protein
LREVAPDRESVLLSPLLHGHDPHGRVAWQSTFDEENSLARWAARRRHGQLAARARQPELARRIGVLMGPAESDPQGQSEITLFRQGLQALGWTGRNVRIAYRYADGEINRMRTFARELIALQPDAVLAVTTPAVTALVDETRTVPIVFVRVSDPLGFDQPGRP